MIRPADNDDRLRAAAFAFLAELTTRRGVATWDDLKRFELEGRRIPLVGQTGIRKVRGYEAALTILTTYRTRPEDRPYQDDVGPDGYPRDKWRGTDPNHSDNVALRRAMELGKPLAWLRGVGSGVSWSRRPCGSSPRSPSTSSSPDLRRQALAAYRTQCALCRLPNGELLDAAHIKEDSEGGEPVVPNGIAMCAIHHRAFDSFVVGVRPDYAIEVRRDVLGEVNDPTLQGIHGSELVVPTRRSARPDRELLEARYERFRAIA